MTTRTEIITLGCRLNTVESEAIQRLADGAAMRDTVVINTCAVTNEAVRSARKTIRRTRRERPDARLMVTGCAAQIDPQSFANMHEVDAVIGNQEKLEPSTWQALAANQNPAMHVNDIMSVRETAGHMIDGYGDRARAFLQIQNGCDHRCTFCIIPFGRGNSRSVPIATVVEQARRLVDAGHKEVVLTGVDITSYGPDLEDNPSLGQLVSAILDQVPNLFRLRLSSVDGIEIDDMLFERLIHDERFAPYLHLSLQAGDNLILKRMKRRHTREQAIELCQNIRERRPEFAFGADIITGFPTETDAMFQRSLDLVDEAGLQYLHVFPFSPREGTPAARMPQLDRNVIKDRATQLRDKGATALHAFLDSLVGQDSDVVIESGGRARLGNFATVKLSEQIGHVGAIARVRFTGRKEDVLLGEEIL